MPLLTMQIKKKVMPFTRASGIILIFLIAEPVRAFLHETLVIASAGFLSGLTKAEMFSKLVGSLVRNPVHTRLIVDTLGGTSPKGIALVGLLGDWLHERLPDLFLMSLQVVPGAWVSAVFQDGSTVLSRTATVLLVEIVFIILGGLLITAGRQKTTWWYEIKSMGGRSAALIGCGLLMQTQAILALVGLGFSASMLEDMKVDLIIELVFKVTDRDVVQWLLRDLLPIAIPIGAITIGIVGTWLVVNSLRKINGRGITHGLQSDRPHGVLNSLAQLGGLLLTIGVLFMFPDFRLAKTNFSPSEPIALSPDTRHSPVIELPSSTATPQPIITPLPTLVTEPPIISILPTSVIPTPVTAHPNLPLPAARFPTKVEIRPVAGKFAFFGDGRQMPPMFGVNYNAWYRAFSPSTQRIFYPRDYSTMQQFGISVVSGWGDFDRLTLQMAKEYGIHVIMPYLPDLDANNWDGKNLKWRQRAITFFQAFVREYTHEPALLAYNPFGSEPLLYSAAELHKTPDDLQALADLIVDFAEAAYQIDPNHVSIVKEVGYLDLFARAISRKRAQKQSPDPSQYLVIGLDNYGTPENVSKSLAYSRAQVEGMLGVMFMVTEFGVVGPPKVERPLQLAEMLKRIAPISDIVLVYVWGPGQVVTTEKLFDRRDPLGLLVGPFSLVDSDGEPVDPALEAMAKKWQEIIRQPLQKSFAWTGTCGEIPSGMAGLLVNNSFGSELDFDIAGKLHRIRPDETLLPIYLPPGKYDWSATLVNPTSGMHERNDEQCSASKRGCDDIRQYQGTYKLFDGHCSVRVFIP